MRILAIETSCDETAVAVVEAAGSGRRRTLRVFANKVSSQIELHAAFGGVVPNLARREHERNLVPVLLDALKEADKVVGFKIQDVRRNRKNALSDKDHHSKILSLKSILEREPELSEQVIKYILPLKSPAVDAIAVTHGPGLAPALWVGVNFAKALGELWRLPVIPVNHLEGHIYTNFLGKEIGTNSKSEIRNPKRKDQHSKRYSLNAIRYPILCLIVSGGHTELVLMKKTGRYEILGETHDDAAGEAFDKVAKMLGLGYPGGPAISALAEKFSISNSQFSIKLPRPMLKSNDYNFSFSGLKTAVLYFLQAHPEFLKSKEGKAAVAREFQDAAVDVLVSKTVRAAKEYKAKTVMIGGGVAANQLLRKKLAEAIASQIPIINYQFPNISLTGDNALMIALAALLGGKRKFSGELKAMPNLRLDSPDS